MGWWKLDETSGATAIDWSGKNNNGTLNGTTFVSNCKRAGCRSFNGSSDNVNAGYAGTDFERTDTFSMSAWAKFINNGGSTQAIIGRYVNSNLGVAFGRKGPANARGNAASCYVWLDSVNNGLEVTSPTSSFPLDQWVNVAFTYDGSSNPSGVKIYINGTSQTVTTFMNNLSGTIKPGVNWRIGDDWTNDWAKGYIDDVRIYNRVLSAQEVSDLYRAGIVLRSGVWRNARFNQ